MATYKEIFGKQIKVLASDPTDTGAEGQIWYNTTANNFKTMLVSDAWSSSSYLLQERGQISMFGTQTSSVAAGGSGPGATMYNDTEEYNGSGWSAGGDLNTTREGSHAAGVLTAGVIVGGFIEPTTYSSDVEEYDGSTWTSVTSTPYAVNNVGAFGTQAASMFAGGDPGSKTTTLEYDGTNWTAGGALTTGRAQQGGACLAPLSAGLIWGGTPLSTAVEEYNGTSWSDGTVLPAGVQFGGGAGTQTAALSFGNFSGPTTITTATTKYDGTSWTAAPALGISQARSQGSGSQAAALLAGGDYPHTTPVATTQEFNRSITVITPASWSAGGSLSNNVFGRSFTSQGTQSAGNVNGGYSPYQNATEEYNGSSWTAGGASANNRYFGTGGGTQTAGLAMGGGLPPSGPGTATDLTEEYNGASWSTGGVMPAPAANMVSGGTQTAGITAGGTGPIVTTNFYDGSSWSAQPGNMNDGVRERTGCGTQSSFIAFGGANPTETAMVADTEEWNGTTWTQTGDLLTAAKSMSCMGYAATDAVANGGRLQDASSIDTTQVFNGTTIQTGVSNSHSAHNNSGNQGCGTSALGFTAAKYVPAQGTEEYVGETSAVNYKTITTS